jgi:VanZ family protein
MSVTAASAWGRRWGWAVCAAAIVVGAVLPAEWLLGVAPRTSWSLLATLAHGLEFALLTALLAWRLLPPEPSRRASSAAVAVAVAAALALAAAIESLQYPLPYRSFELWDLVADAVGVACAALAVSLVARRRGARAPDR